MRSPRRSSERAAERGQTELVRTRRWPGAPSRTSKRTSCGRTWTSLSFTPKRRSVEKDDARDRVIRAGVESKEVDPVGERPAAVVGAGPLDRVAAGRDTGRDQDTQAPA